MYFHKCPFSNYMTSKTKYSITESKWDINDLIRMIFLFISLSSAAFGYFFILVGTLKIMTDILVAKVNDLFTRKLILGHIPILFDNTDESEMLSQHSISRLTVVPSSFCGPEFFILFSQQRLIAFIT